MKWKQTVNLYWIVFAFCLVIATGFAAMGLWLIMPFTGIELLVLGIVLYRCALRSKDYEVIAIDDDRITISRNIRRRDEEFSFQRYWAKVSLVPPQRRNFASRLLIQSHGKALEIGVWLNEEERKGLANILSLLVNRKNHENLA